MLIVIVGLPGSGKTCLAKSMTDTIVYDDFLFDNYKGNVLRDLRDGKRVCATDPRLCVASVFDRCMKQWQKVTRNIEVTVYKNDPVQCLHNAPHRHVDITKLSKVYDTNHYNGKIINVFNQ